MSFRNLLVVWRESASVCIEFCEELTFEACTITFPDSEFWFVPVIDLLLRKADEVVCDNGEYFSMSYVLEIDSQSVVL